MIMNNLNAALLNLALLLSVLVPIYLLITKNFNESWLQFVGLVGISLSSAALFDNVAGSYYIPPEMALLAFSMAGYLVGVALKVLRSRLSNHKKRISPPTLSG